MYTRRTACLILSLILWIILIHDVIKNAGSYLQMMLGRKGRDQDNHQAQVQR